MPVLRGGVHEVKTSILTINQIEGFHRWPQAPVYLAYLRDRHRHVFTVECEFDVSHDDRDIEIISMQHQIAEYFRGTYGNPAELGDMSCEAIARGILEYYPKCRSVTVREDGFGGGRVRRCF